MKNLISWGRVGLAALVISGSLLVAGAERAGAQTGDSGAVEPVPFAEGIDVPEDLVQVIVIYDPEHDGTPRGVGEGVLLIVTRAGEIYALGITDPLSSETFDLEHGHIYLITARVPPTRLFFEWVCAKAVNATNPGVIVIECYEFFVLRLPFAIAS